MAIFMTQSKYTFFQKLGMEPWIINWLEANQVVLQLGFYELRLIDKNGAVLYEVELPVSTNMLMKGEAPITQVKVVLGQLTSSIKALKLPMLAQLDPTASDEPVALAADSGTVTGSTKPKFEDLDHPTSKESPKEPPTLDLTYNHPSQVKIKKTMSEAPVQLKDATRLYQPVYGTSAGSIYYAIALNKSVKVAARITSDQISIRAEGDIAQHLPAFNSVQLTSKGDYVSGHFAYGHIPPERLIGAVLAGCGIAFDTPIPVVAFLKGKGA